MDRKEFQDLSKIRLKEAQALLQLGHFDGAFYLAGYSVECALKACIAKQTRRGEFPDKKTVESSHTHNLLQLLKVAGLEAGFAAQAKKDPGFLKSWRDVQSWSEQSRYRKNPEASARELLVAIGDRRHGILSWIKQQW